MEQLELVHDGLPDEVMSVKFGAFVTMLIENEKLYKSLNTINGYRGTFKMATNLHDMELSKIKTTHIRAIIDSMVKQRYSIATIRKYTTCLSHFFERAIEPHGLIFNNPVKKVVYPAETLKEQSQEIKALTKAETTALLSKIKERYPQYHVICQLAVTSGLRMGELLGLTHPGGQAWSDIDFQNGVVNVNKQWKQSVNGGYEFGVLKTKNSKRKVPIPASTIEVLAKYRSSLTVLTLDNRVFPFGYPVGATLARAFRAVGFNITPHDLRHTFATHLIANGVDVKTIASLTVPSAGRWVTTLL